MATAIQPVERRTEKSAQAFRTISEVATELDVPQHVLRFWESKFSQVRPLKRGGGRRYYRPEDIDLLRQIRSLLYDEGYTIKGAQKLLRTRRARLASDEPTQTVVAPLQPRAAVGTARLLPAETRRRLGALRAELAELRELLGRARIETP